MPHKLYVAQPVSGGIILSYKCTNDCQHCMYACSPKWKANWISVENAEKVLIQLSAKLKNKYPKNANRIGVNYGVHFTGGEPFLNFELLLKLTKLAHGLEIPLTFVETNCFWCADDEITEKRLADLKNEGLCGMLISANPFIVEHIPFERIECGIKISRKIFGTNVIIYHELFYTQLKELGIKGKLSFENYLDRMRKTDPRSLELVLSFPSLIPMGRMPYKLGYLYRKYPAAHFSDALCKEELTRGWHVHVDNYCNYMTGYCGGISLGDAKKLDALCQGIDLKEHPILEVLISGGVKKLYEFGVKEFGYKELADGYISKCHLCVDIRKHLAHQTDEFKELQPREFYYHLE